MEQSAIIADEKRYIRLWMTIGSMNRGVHTAEQRWMHGERKKNELFPN
jgi:hypothetical protein